jgi:hypothetical protein
MSDSNLPPVYAALLKVAHSELQASSVYSFYLIAKEHGLSEAKKCVSSLEAINFSCLLKRVGVDVNSYRPLASVHPIRPN